MQISSIRALRDTAQRLVFGSGNPCAKIVLIGEGPGPEEDRQGVPFVGASGRLLGQLLGVAGLSIGDVYICNILKYAAPGMRNPRADEMKEHTPYLLEQLQIICPEWVVALGNFAAKFVLAGFQCGVNKSTTGEKIGGILSEHGKVRMIALPGAAKRVRVFPTLHPAAVLRQPDNKSVLFGDFEELGRLMRSSGIGVGGASVMQNEKKDETDYRSNNDEEENRFGMHKETSLDGKSKEMMGIERLKSEARIGFCGTSPSSPTSPLLSSTSPQPFLQSPTRTGVSGITLIRNEEKNEDADHAETKKRGKSRLELMMEMKARKAEEAKKARSKEEGGKIEGIDNSKITQNADNNKKDDEGEQNIKETEAKGSES
eukprot:MONOS_11850.1-p1 / transcript=MONOS_11850.1 / gene=MONOS_11850 / organism=Monocercomonoides_exilis_PA203 / gene_product=uracil-DNA glycosylase / transcript_product=uracil-DNA glycosylase / location=Mono_scaffold00618:15007-16122(-) / protein_length=372 / sequence_SO=supercontig / SO=protein_coding / is_pseudo=false